jgi:hypothetical protein
MGSSASRTLGCCISARAMATRCCWPPDSVSARCSAVFAMPSRSSACDREGAFVAREHLRDAAPSSTVSCSRPSQDVGQHVETRHEVELLEDHRAVRPPCAQLLPFSWAISSPKRICPSDGSISRFRMRSSVDLPAPDAADDADHLAIGNDEVRAVDGEVVAEAAGQLFEFQHGCPLMRCHGLSFHGLGRRSPPAEGPGIRRRGRCRAPAPSTRLSISAGPGARGAC